MSVWRTSLTATICSSTVLIPCALQAVDRVGADDIDALAKSAFPLCMSTLHEGLKANHHLRHAGRMQYGLFLKGIGLSLEDALIFWQREFTKSMSVEDFLKKYAYNIRHNYGKEGKRQDYTPHSCVKIILGTPPGNNEYHGTLEGIRLFRFGGCLV